MKRLLTAVAAVALGASASFGQVTSQNAVGFANLDVQPNFNFFSYNWQDLGGADTRDIQQLISGDLLASGLVGGLNPVVSDNVLLWDASAQVFGTYYLYDSSGAYPNWDGKWVDASTGLIATETTSRGDGFWLNHKGAGTTATVVGQVPESATSTSDIVLGFNAIGPSYSSTVAFNDASLDWSNGKGGLNPVVADNILIWDNVAQSFSTVYLYDSSGAYPLWDGKWVDASTGLISTDTFRLGQGQWYKSQQAGVTNVVTETRPYADPTP